MNYPDSEAPKGSEQKSPWRGAVVFFVKSAVTVSLIVWLVRSGALEVSKLKIFLDSFEVLFVSLGSWLALQVGLATWRWRILLQVVGAHVPLPRAAALQITALFFNGLVPGNVGGDFVKNQAVLGNQGGRLFALVLAERTLGLVSLIWAGAVGLALSLGRIQEHEQLIPVALALSVLILGTLLGPWGLWALLKRAPRNQQEQGATTFFQRTVQSGLAAFDLVQKSKGAVTQGLAVGFVMHLGNIALFLFLARHLGNPGASFGDIALVFPLGMLTLILPVSISGLGVGHVMFEEFFALLGLTGGANVFNAYIVAQLTPCLLGAATYLFMRNPPAAGPQ